MCLMTVSLQLVGMSCLHVRLGALVHWWIGALVHSSKGSKNKSKFAMNGNSFTYVSTAKTSGSQAMTNDQKEFFVVIKLNSKS